jgi:hypothetical protein
MQPALRFSGCVLPLVAILGCTGRGVDVPAAEGALRVQWVASPPGVLDRGADPAVLRVESAGVETCAGALLAPDLVVTARHCVSMAQAPLACPGVDPAALQPVGADAILVASGEAEPAPVLARVRRVLVPPDDLCSADLALLVLGDAIDSIEPLVVRRLGAARGDHVRTVGLLAGAGSAGGARLVRDHVPVLDSSDSAFSVDQPPGLEPGGPALDEASGELVGIASRSETAATTAYVRADAFDGFIAQALAESAPVPASRGSSVLRATRGPVDLGAACRAASACAAGVCATDAQRQYCTRRCGALDVCPARFRCERVQIDVGPSPPAALWACAER